MGATVWEMLDPIPIHIAHERVRGPVVHLAARDAGLRGGEAHPVST